MTMAVVLTLSGRCMKTSRKSFTILILTFAVLLALNWWDREWKFLLLWAMHVVPTAIIGVPIWFFARHRVNWNGSDFLIITAPFLAYLAAALVFPVNKGMGNLVEPLLLGCFLPLSPLTRVMIGQRTEEEKLSAGLLLALCLLSVVLYVLVPAME